MKRVLMILLAMGMTVALAAQPARRRVTTTNDAVQRGAEREVKTDRASLLFPVKEEMPEDVVWKREVYRTLDLMHDANAPFYYPVEPRGRQVNLFTYVFRLVLTGRINAYTYKLDGVESFEEKDRMEVRDLLDRYSIYYEEKDGRLSVADTDIPSAEVTRYYVKESVYLDQRTGTFSTRVTALCPVLMRGADDFGGEATPYPLFWINYDEASSWLARLPIMASNLNNTCNMTADDYFVMNRYKGRIYKTNNMQGRALAHYCTTDSAMQKEQARIEKEIIAFEEGVWGHMSHEDSVRVARQDSIEAAENPSPRRKSSARRGGRRTPEVKAERPRGGGGGNPGGARVSVRRQRR